MTAHAAKVTTTPIYDRCGRARSLRDAIIQTNIGQRRSLAETDRPIASAGGPHPVADSARATASASASGIERFERSTPLMVGTHNERRRVASGVAHVEHPERQPEQGEHARASRGPTTTPVGSTGQRNEQRARAEAGRRTPSDPRGSDRRAADTARARRAPHRPPGRYANRTSHARRPSCALNEIAPSIDDDREEDETMVVSRPARDRSARSSVARPRSVGGGRHHLMMATSAAVMGIRSSSGARPLV